MVASGRPPLEWQAEPEQRLLTFVVFALCTAPVAFGGAWALLPCPDAAAGPEHPDDTVEQNWYLRATSGAFTDVLAAAGIAVTAKHVLGAPDVPLELILVLGFADVGLRMLVLSRREA